jgi:hypothetical protein
MGVVSADRTEHEALTPTHVTVFNHCCGDQSSQLQSF